jgi:type IV pilus assembly protein PilM
MNSSVADPEERGPSLANFTFAPGVAGCYRCGHANAQDRRFCSQCGGSLWADCPVCTTECAVSETYCGSCGANLEELCREEARNYDKMLVEAKSLWASHEYVKAMDTLRPLVRKRDPRFDSYREQADRWLQQISDEKAQAQIHHEEACEVAQRHVDRYDYRAAVEALEAVPRKLRDDRFDRFLQDVRGKHEELCTLNDQVSRSVKSGRLEALGEKLERILVLQPAHATARRLAGQFRDRQVRLAKAWLAEHRYEAASAALEEIPASQWDDNLEKIKSLAAELNWLASDIKLAAVADRRLLAIAERLVKLQPQDQTAAGALEQVRKRLGQAPRDRRFAAPDLSSPKSTVFDMPVDWLATPGRIAVAAQATESVRRHPGRFWVACGLALQGVGRAVISMNMATAQRKDGVLQRLAWRRRKEPQTAWGVELGATALKAVKLVSDAADDGPVTLQQAVLLEHEEVLVRADDAEKRRKVQIAALEAFVSQHDLQGARLCIGISSLSVLGRFLRLPPVEAKRMEEAVCFEASRQIPLPLDELAWDYHAWPLPGSADEEKDETTNAWRILIHAVKKYYVDEIVSIGTEAGTQVDIVTSELLALHNLATFEFLQGEDADRKRETAVALLDVGAQGSALVIASRNSTWFRHLPVGGDAVTGRVAKAFKLTRSQAELVKANPTRARRVTALYEAIDPPLSHLGDEIRRSFELHGKLFPDVQVSHLLGCGGGFAQHGLMKRLRSGR